jgi:peptide/nickel transport system ATP-binding protein
MTSLLCAKNLNLALGGTPILRSVSLDIGAGEAVGLIGESGSGKSMFARTVLGLLPYGAKVAGSVSFEGRELLGLDDRSYRLLRGSRIAYVPQDPVAAFNPTLRVGRQICEPFQFHPDVAASMNPPDPAELLRSVGVNDPERRARQYPHELSGGMLQRALIASAVSLKPSLLVADEPTTGLDVTTQAGIMVLLRSLQERSGMALLLISHDLALVSMMCRRIAVMYRGEVVESGTTRELVGAPGHAYTRALLAATPSLERPRSRVPFAASSSTA